MRGEPKLSPAERQRRRLIGRARRPARTRKRNTSTHTRARKRTHICVCMHMRTNCSGSLLSAIRRKSSKSVRDTRSSARRPNLATTWPVTTRIWSNSRFLATSSTLSLSSSLVSSPPAELACDAARCSMAVAARGRPSAARARACNGPGSQCASGSASSVACTIDGGAQAVRRSSRAAQHAAPQSRSYAAFVAHRVEVRRDVVHAQLAAHSERHDGRKAAALDIAANLQFDKLFAIAFVPVR